MANYQVLFNGDVLEDSSADSVRENLARELGLDERKAKQLFSGRTVVIRSQLEQHEAQAWQDRFAELGAIARIKNLVPNEQPLGIRDNAGKEPHDRTLRDITAAHLECPRCGHLQLDASHCTRCGVDLEAAFRQKRKEDIMIEKKIRELKQRREADAKPALRSVKSDDRREAMPEGEASNKKSGVLHWLKRS
ncbi:MAG: hypothetical protein ACI9ON_000364 [Limisphaerales bacterium]|jgi:ribosomal protein L37E